MYKHLDAGAASSRFLMIATAVLIAVTAGCAGQAPIAPQSFDSPTSSPAFTPQPTPVAPSSASSTVRPTPLPDATLIWTPTRLEKDWPAPVRAEPLSGGLVKSMGLGSHSGWDSSDNSWGPFVFHDAIGDLGIDDHEWLDITEVHLKVRDTALPLTFNLILAGVPELPFPHPATRWIAYGVVADTNGDGLADARVGMDNIPGEQHRDWLTDLATGDTVAAGSSYGRTNFDTYYPGEGAASSNRALFWNGRIGSGEQDFPFYAWASLIESGRVIATDYAPDAGWLERGIQPDLPLSGIDWRNESELHGPSPSSTRTQIRRILFREDGRISFAAGCHTGYARVTMGSDSLRVTDLDLTDISCTTDVARLDSAFMAVLTAGSINYTIDGGHLTLAAGGRSIRFVGPHEGDPAPGIGSSP